MATAKKSATDFLADEYLARLLSFSVEAIRKEPENLQSQKAALKQEVLETALTHYQGFIEAASCFQEISTHVKKLRTELTNLSDCLDSLQEQANTFTGTAEAYKVQNRALSDFTGLRMCVMWCTDHMLLVIDFMVCIHMVCNSCSEPQLLQTCAFSNLP
jgi:hypothetical protein